MEHTPGPWELRKLQTGYSIRTSAEIQISGNYPAKKKSLFQVPFSAINAEANAHLAAAAPDLLAACREFVRKVECGEARSKRSYAQMKAAIDKAEGKS